MKFASLLVMNVSIRISGSVTVTGRARVNNCISASEPWWLGAEELNEFVVPSAICVTMTSDGDETSGGRIRRLSLAVTRAHCLE